AEAAAPPGTGLGAARSDTGAAISLQLEDAFGDGRDDVVELLLQALSGKYQGAADHRVSATPDAAPAEAAAGDLGRAARPSQCAGPRLRGGPGSAAYSGRAGGLHSRVHSRGRDVER